MSYLDTVGTIRGVDVAGDGDVGRDGDDEWVAVVDDADMTAVADVDTAAVAAAADTFADVADTDVFVVVDSGMDIAVPPPPSPLVNVIVVVDC